VTLSPGQSVSGSATLRPGSGGPPDYTVYTGYNDPVTGKLHFPPDAPFITLNSIVAPAATDIQINGTASNGSPSTGSEFTYTYQVKNAGPWLHLWRHRIRGYASRVAHACQLFCDVD